MRDGDIPWCVHGKLDGIVFDVLPPTVPLSFDAASHVSFGEGRSLRVVDLEGLLRLKLKAGGPQDLLDVAQLLRRHPEMAARVQPVAEAYGHWDGVLHWVKDPRVR